MRALASLSLALSSHSWQVINNSDVFSDEVKSRLDALFREFYPIEINHELPYETRLAAILEWWSKAHATLAAARPRRADFRRAVADVGAGMRFRARMHELFAQAAADDVPLLVFSAGVGDVIAEVLAANDLDAAGSVSIVSNFLRYGVGDNCDAGCAWNDPLIHVFNKVSDVSNEGK